MEFVMLDDVYVVAAESFVPHASLHHGRQKTVHKAFFNMDISPTTVDKTAA